MEQINTWISSLKANPDCDEPEFIAIVYYSLHTRMLEEHGDELMLDENIHGDKKVRK